MANYRDVEPDSGLEVVQPGLEVPDSQPRSTRSDSKEAAPLKIVTNGFQYAEGDGDYRQKTSRNPFGLSPLVFGVLVALITSVILGAALGGGLGSAIHSSSKEASCSPSTTTTAPSTQTACSSSATPTTNLTDFVVTPADSIDNLSLGEWDCPELGTSHTYTTPNHDLFSFTCDVDYVGNDLLAIVAYSLDDCCKACSNMNLYQKGSTQCRALSFHANMSQACLHDYPPGCANCWLKNATSDGATGYVGRVISAVLQSSAARKVL